jgi:hypothetical protein
MKNKQINTKITLGIASAALVLGLGLGLTTLLWSGGLAQLLQTTTLNTNVSITGDLTASGNATVAGLLTTDREVFSANTTQTITGTAITGTTIIGSTSTTSPIYTSSASVAIKLGTVAPTAAPRASQAG